MIDYIDEMRRTHPLKSLFFELTDACNLQCLHCGSSCSPAKARYLDPVLIEKTLDSVERERGDDLPFICLTGGEPLLHPDFYSIGTMLSVRGYRWGITTNATLIDEEAACNMVEAGMTSVAFSLDGTPRTHDKLRARPGAFDAAVKGIKNAVKQFRRRVATMVTTVVYRDNIDELDEVFKIVADLGVDYWRPINVEPIGRANKSKELFLRAEEYRKLLDYIARKRKKKAIPEVTFGCSHFLPERYETKVRDGEFLCYSGITNASILVDGGIFGCLDIERRASLVQGNVKGDDFMSVWREGFLPFRRDRSECDFCRECKDRRLCVGDAAHTWDYETNRPLLCLRKLIGR